ncbi:MAG: hypothetical protein RSD57_19025 [Comamonas sp.]
MTAHYRNDQRYSLQATIHSSNENGSANRTFKVLASAPGSANLSYSGTQKPAQVALQDGSGNTAYFTADQAHQLANALMAAAGSNGDPMKADC